MRELYFFDCDGPIFRSASVAREVYNEVCEHYGLDICNTDGDFGKLFESDEFFRRMALLSRHGSDFNLDAFQDHLMHELAARYHEVPLVEKMGHILNEICMKHIVKIVTSNRDEVIVPNLRMNHVSGSISVLGSECGTSKQTRMRNLYEAYNRRPTYMVTDTTNDILAARRAVPFESGTPRIKTIAVSWGYQTRESLLDSKRKKGGLPDYILDHPSQLWEFARGTEADRQRFAVRELETTVINTVNA